MKLINFRQGAKVKLGIVTDQGMIDVERAGRQLDLGLPLSMEEAIAQGREGIERLSLLLRKELPMVPVEEVAVAPVIHKLEKILCIGLNYREHAKESGEKIPDFPVVFCKLGNALSAHGQEISIPPAVTKCDYEAELVVVIGRKAVDVSEEEALDYVFGYAPGNDLSARDLQFLSSQWLLGKTCDGFAPVGPCITTADEVDPASLEITCRVNGEIRQQSNTSLMMFSVARLVSTLSRYLPLRPGDLLFTGTPPGVILGYPQEKQAWLKPGDRVEVSVEGLGTLCNTLA